MQTWSLIILYVGLGLALALLRRQQGARTLEALVDGLLWPLEIMRTSLLLIAHILGRPPGSDPGRADRGEIPHMV